MSERTENVFKTFAQSAVRDYTETPNVIEQGKISPEALARIEKASKGELKAKLAQILDRGIVGDRLHVDLPDHLHGEWVRNDPLEINRLQALGFQIDTEYAPKRAIHSDGTNSGIVGDTIHMTCPMEIKEIIDEIREEQILKQHTKRRHNGADLNKEELDLIKNVEGESNHEATISGFARSTERRAGNKDLADILSSVDDQVVPYDK